MLMHYIDLYWFISLLNKNKESWGGDPVLAFVSSCIAEIK